MGPTIQGTLLGNIKARIETEYVQMVGRDGVSQAPEQARSIYQATYWHSSAGTPDIRMRGDTHCKPLVR